MLYGIQAGFGSPQVPVAELLARPAPTLLSPQKPKSSNFLQVPDVESPRYVRVRTVVVVALLIFSLISPVLEIVDIEVLSVKRRNSTSFAKERGKEKKKKD